jgi:hypothetical protein
VPESTFAAHALADARLQFRKYRALAEGALSQVADADFFRAPDPESNSIALVVKHLAGNMRSRWQDFLTTDGEKPDRHRDREFEVEPSETRASLMAAWERGWRLTFEAVDPLTPDDLLREVRIRGEAHTIWQAIERQIAHYAYHVGQIVYIAKHFAGSKWRSLSIPKGKSAEFDVARNGSTYRTK